MVLLSRTALVAESSERKARKIDNVKPGDASVDSISSEVLAPAIGMALTKWLQSS